MPRLNWRKNNSKEWDNIPNNLSNFEELQLVEEVKDLLGSLINGFLGSLYFLVSSGQSPIEQVMAVVLNERLSEIDGLCYHIEPQGNIPVGKKEYFTDLRLEIYKGDEVIEFAIECDGHEFHEKTKEQARKDKARERAMQSQGVRVIRFTGSEIWENPYKCAEEVVTIIARSV